MAGLTSIFGGNDDSNSSSDGISSSDLVSDVTSTVGLDASSSQTNFNQDEDGNTTSSTNDNALNLDTSTDGLLGGASDTFDSSDESQS